MNPHPHRQTWRARLATAFAQRTRTYRSRSLGWRMVAPVVFLVAGVLFVTSMVSSEGRDIRAGRYDDLHGLANAQAKDLEELRAQAADLTAEVDRLTRDLGTVGDTGERARVRGLARTAGLSPVWAGGAEAMTIQGQRVVSTTGIKCVGNVVILHGVPYSPPYRVSAIGPTDEMLTSVTTSPYIQLYLDVVQSSQLGWDVAVDDSMDMPGYTGSTDLEYARPAG